MGNLLPSEATHSADRVMLTLFVMGTRNTVNVWLLVHSFISCFLGYIPAWEKTEG